MINQLLVIEGIYHIPFQKLGQISLKKLFLIIIMKAVIQKGQVVFKNRLATNYYQSRSAFRKRYTIIIVL